MNHECSLSGNFWYCFFQDTNHILLLGIEEEPYGIFLLRKSECLGMAQESDGDISSRNNRLECLMIYKQRDKICYSVIAHSMPTYDA